jgi:hypothetical protein
MEGKQALQNLHLVQQHIAQVSQEYFHSTPLSTTPALDTELPFGLFDWGLIGAIAEYPLKLVGETDRGKTDFAKVLMTGLFGEEETGWHKTDVDKDFGDLTVADAEFSAIAEGKSTRELYTGKEWLSLPGLIWDEPNRAPSKVLNKMLHILEKDFSLPNGNRIKTGHQDAKSEERYQFHILAMNEGAEYSGTSAVDRALNRRQTLEIPIDAFPTSALDKLQMSRKRKGTIHIEDGTGHLEEILQLWKFTKDIEMTPEAELYRIYLQSMGACVHSVTGTKRGINLNQALCEGKAPVITGDATTPPQQACHFLGSYPENLCPNIYELSDGVAIQLGTIAKAHALLRTYKSAMLVAEKCMITDSKSDDDDPEAWKKQVAKKKLNNEFEEAIQFVTQTTTTDPQKLAKEYIETISTNMAVLPQDIHAALPFIAYSKQEVNPHWITAKFQGSRPKALEFAHATAYNNVQRFLSEHSGLFTKMVQEEELKAEEQLTLEEAIKDDYWMSQALVAYTTKKAQPIAPSKIIFE